MLSRIKRILLSCCFMLFFLFSTSNSIFASESITPKTPLSVSFENPYAKVGEPLTILTSKEENINIQWSIGGVKLAAASKSYTPTEQDLEKWIEVSVTSAGEEAHAKLYFSKLPVVYIETENQEEISSKENYLHGSLRIQGNDLYNTETSTLYDGEIDIRGRGNSTWYQPKKPYKIKLDKKTDVFGMGKNKHWVLLANFLDDSLMRNTLSYDFSGSLGMEQMSTVWVDVVLNGEYVGNYQFCEQVRADETRVDIFDWESFAEDTGELIAKIEQLDEDALSTHMLEHMEWITTGFVNFQGKTYAIADYPEIEIPSIDGGYLLELDEYYDEISKFRTNSNQPIMLKNPEFVNTNPEMMDFIQTYVQAYEDAVHSSSYTSMYKNELVHYSDLYNLDSLVDYWLVSELFLNEEFNKKSTYMYKGIGEPMKMGPIWDMDLSAGAITCDNPGTDFWGTLYFDSYEQGEQWYKYLVNDPYFLTKLQNRYSNVRDVQIQDLLSSIDISYDYLKESGKADTIRWEGQSFFRTSFEDNAQALKKWLFDRVAWMDEQMTDHYKFASWFYKADRNLNLALSDKGNTNLPTVSSSYILSQNIWKNKENIVLTITGQTDHQGQVHIFVNGRKIDNLDTKDTSNTIIIPAEQYLAYAGAINTIEVKVINGQGSEVAKNYIAYQLEGFDTENPEDPEKPVDPEKPTDEEKYFEDVFENDFYYKAVYWATKSNVTAGWTETLFAPHMVCTRGQVVTFLYRLAGQPTVTTSKNPFLDVASGSYYEKAVLWALEKGITSGFSDTQFAPEAICTRAQIVTFLWRSSGRQSASSSSCAFKDVSEDAYYYQAILWAIENNVTSGYSDLIFAPEDECTRGRIVTFLWRIHGK